LRFQQQRATVKNEKGFVLVLALMSLLFLTLLGLSAMSTSVFDIKIGANDYSSKKAFFVAEAGWNEFKARFKTGEITDNAPTETNWMLFIAPAEARAKEIGYIKNPGQTYIQSVQSQFDYATMVTHKVENNKVVTRAGHPVYVATSHGWSGEANKVVQVTFHKSPNLDPPGALYSKTSVFVKGSSTHIIGNDVCQVVNPINKPGIITTSDTIAISGSPVIEGTPEDMITRSPLNLQLGEYVTYLKDYANISYSYMKNQTLTGVDFGSLSSGGKTDVPVKPTDPLSEPNIVYFNMNIVNTIKLAGSSHGEGILLVDGNLELNGGFAWYGIIIVTGALTFTGGGEKNITGGVLAGEMTSLEVEVSGNTAILYCSEVMDFLKNRVPAFKTANWKQVYKGGSGG
jgi:Tfp pilus assembly protein PilX